MKQESIRAALIGGAIHVIAREGLDKATTKRIGAQTGLNEVYIYRCFKGKEDLFVQAFLQLDYEFIAEVMQSVSVMDMTEIPIEERCRLFFDLVWDFVMREREKNECYIQYYHSPYFAKYSLKGRKERFAPVIERCKGAFKPDVDVWTMLNHILDILFASASRVYQGELQEDEQTAKHVFDLIYSGIEPYLAWSRK